MSTTLRITRNGAKMIAEELYKLMNKNIGSQMQDIISANNTEWLNTNEAADYMGVSVSYIKNNIRDIPHTKMGRINKFRKSDLNNYLIR